MNAEVRNKIFRLRRQSDPNARKLEIENENQEGDGKVKTKLLSMWNNMKYGWTVKMKTNFSRDSPVWLLGQCYHRKMDTNVIADECSPAEVVEGEGIEGFKADFISRIWLTYRREFPILNGSNFTTDCGWGCMLRSGQMLLAQALVCHFLGRDWRWHPDEPITSAVLYNEDKNHRKIIKWFGDNPSCNSPLSIHSLVGLGQACGKKAGDWYGPGAVAHLLRQAVELGSRDNADFQQLCVYVAQDCAVYIQDVLDLCEGSHEKSNTLAESHAPSAWKSLILLVPVRLGAEKLNSIYAPCLTAVLTLKNCIGIIGGRPKHSLYFVGYQDDKLIHLDPHYCQEVVNVWGADFPLGSFHCKSPRKMPLSKMDPSCCIGFYCRTREDFRKFVKTVEQFLVPPFEKADCPMFVFCEGRSRESLNVKRFNIPDDRYTDSNLPDTDDELECEEFEII